LAAPVLLSLATGGGHFADPVLEVSNFGLSAGGWTSNNDYPRLLADVNGDGLADIVGFGGAGAFVSLATGGGHFADPVAEVSNFGLSAGGWTSNDLLPNQLNMSRGDRRHMRSKRKRDNDLQLCCMLATRSRESHRGAAI
jgi:hypothetical protein